MCWDGVADGVQGLCRLRGLPSHGLLRDLRLSLTFWVRRSHLRTTGVRLAPHHPCEMKTAFAWLSFLSGRCRVCTPWRSCPSWYAQTDIRFAPSWWLPVIL